MKIKVILGSEEQVRVAIPCPPQEEDLRSYYLHHLEKAADAGEAVAGFQGFSYDEEKPSRSFQKMSIMEQTILSFLQTHDAPQEVHIICADEPSARQYKVVYNFQFATTKEERMEDDHWD